MISGLELAHTVVARNPDSDTRIVWAHGWGQNGAAFIPMAEAFAGRAENLVLDLPGFGRSPPPPETWGTAEYAEAIADWLGQLPPRARTVWVGHSFGCRVGIQLAARRPERLDRLVLIAAAGLKRRRTLPQTLRFRGRTLGYKLLKRAYGWLGRDPTILANRFGSADYRNAGALRPIFVKVIAEDLSAVARQVACPVDLVFGREDTETPLEFGERYQSLMPAARLHVLDHQDHYSVLGEGRHAVVKIISDALKASS